MGGRSTYWSYRFSVRCYCSDASNPEIDAILRVSYRILTGTKFDRGLFNVSVNYQYQGQGTHFPFCFTCDILIESTHIGDAHALCKCEGESSPIAVYNGTLPGDSTRQLITM